MSVIPDIIGQNTKFLGFSRSKWNAIFEPLGFGPQFRLSRDQDFSIEAVEDQLTRRLATLEKDPASVASMTGFPWIININLNTH
jgi:hypothetical protein